MKEEAGRKDYQVRLGGTLEEGGKGRERERKGRYCKRPGGCRTQNLKILLNLVHSDVRVPFPSRHRDKKDPQAEGRGERGEGRGDRVLIRPGSHRNSKPQNIVGLLSRHVPSRHR
jgi:hypothetical protein